QLPLLMTSLGVLSFARRAAGALLSAALFVAAPLAAQVALDAPAAAGRKIVRAVDVEFQGVSALDPDRVRAQMSTRVGEPYTDEAVERDLRNLYQTGAVENVDIRA